MTTPLTVIETEPLSMKTVGYDRIAVSEIYPAIQGEGTRCGRPSIFVRLSECNLSCSFCDTPYTWDWTGKNGVAYSRAKEQRRLSPSELAAELEAAMKAHKIYELVFTGGEPMLWQRPLVTVLNALDSEGCGKAFAYVETNGTLSILPDFGKLVSEFSVSPKLFNSGDPEHKRITAALPNYLKYSSIFKFVVTSDPKDIEEIERLVRRFHIHPRRVWLMGEGKTREEQEILLPQVVEWALKKHYNVSPRLHVMTYGNKRGV